MANIITFGKTFLPQIRGLASRQSSNFIYKTSLFEELNLKGLKYAPNSDTLKITGKPIQSAEEAINKIGIKSEIHSTTNIKPLKYTSTAKPFDSAEKTGGKPVGVYREDGTYLGKCSYENLIEKHTWNNASYPSSWIDPTTNIPKSSLYVRYISTPVTNRNKGNGREIMKRLYLQSIENGHEGRISLQAAWDSPGFYEKLGFENDPRVLESAKRELKSLESRLMYFESNGIDCYEEFTTKAEFLKEIQEQKKLISHIPCKQGNLYFTPTEENLAKLFAK